MFQIFVQGLFTTLDLGTHVLEDVETFLCTSFHDSGVVGGVVHHFSEGAVHAFELFGLLGELLLDILGFHEDVHQKLPVLLDLGPFFDTFLDHVELLDPVLDGVDEEGDVFALRFHSLEIHGVLIEQFEHGVHSGKALGVASIIFELEDLFLPGRVNKLQFLFDFGFLLGHVDDLIHSVFIFEKLEVQDVFEVKLGVVVIKTLLTFILHLLPMSLLHELTVKRTDQREDDSHIFNLGGDGVVASEISNLLEVLQLVLNDFILFLEQVCVDTFPKGGLPVSVLELDDGDGVPHDLSIFQVHGTFFQLSIFVGLQVEQFFEVFVMRGLFLDNVQFVVVLFDDGVAVVHLLHREVVAVGLGDHFVEFLTEFTNLSGEVPNVGLNISLFQDLEREDGVLDIQDFLGSVFEHGEVGVDFLLSVDSLLGDDDALLLEGDDHLLHSVDDSLGLGLHGLHFGDDFHDLHQQFFILFIVSWGVLDSVSGGLNEPFQVLQGLLELRHQEVGVGVDPGVQSIRERAFQWG